MSADKKIHLYHTDSPIAPAELSDLHAQCGYQFVEASPVWMFRDDFEPVSNWLDRLNIFYVCKKCVEISASDPDQDKRYIYGLAESWRRFSEPSTTFSMDAQD